MRLSYLFIFIGALVIIVANTGCTAVGKSSAGMQSSSSVQGNNVTNPFVAEPFVLGALGDSISRGFDIASLDSEDLPENWSTGTALPNSIVNQVASVFSSRGWTVNSSGLNLAVVGDTVLGANSTLQAGAAQLASAGAQVVTIEIGANDVCQGNLASVNSSAQFRAAIVTALQTLMNSSRPPTVIAVASVPNIWSLTQTPGLNGSSYCQAAWALLCPNLSVGQTEFEAEWSSVNLALREAAAQVGGVVVYDNGAVASAQFGVNDVSSLDCFHPSVSGQELLAGAVWTTIQSKIESKW